MAFTERSYPFKRKQEGGDGFWRRKCEIAESYVRGYHVYQRIWNPFVREVAVAVREEGNVHDRYAGWSVLLLALLTVTIVIDHYYDLSRSPRTALRLFLGWLCRRSLADWQWLVYPLEKLRDFASTSHTCSYLLLEIFHTGTMYQRRHNSNYVSHRMIFLTRNF